MNRLPSGERLAGGLAPSVSESADAWGTGWPQSPAEFETLVDACLDRLVGYAYRRLGNIEDAEDAVQEVLVRAFRDRSKRKRTSAVRPYLFRMVANACTDLLRKRNYAAVFREEIEVEHVERN